VTGKTKLVSFQANEENNYTMAELSSNKNTQDTLIKDERLYKLGVPKQSKRLKRIAII
jgi:hypothetical protein